MIRNSCKQALFFAYIILLMILSSCGGYRKLIVDEIVMKDESSHTGTIVKCDSTNIKLKKMDESISIIPWTNVDTVQGKKLKTFWGGINFGYYNTPYFSVFRNEAMVGKAGGMQFKMGTTRRGRRLFYGHLTTSWAKPYSITKFGIATQRYSKKSSYLKDRAFFRGCELNLMNAKNNNGAQVTLEPFLGFEKKFSEHLRLHVKFALQLNLANKNNQSGFNITLGLHALKRNFKKYYTILNEQRRLPVKKPGVFGVH